MGHRQLRHQGRSLSATMVDHGHILDNGRVCLVVQLVSSNYRDHPQLRQVEECRVIEECQVTQRVEQFVNYIWP
jgi:hypothetical protein